MRTRLLARRRAARTIDPSAGPLEFEFAHLLDARPQAKADAMPCAAADLEKEIDSILAKFLAAESEPEVVSEDAPDVVQDVAQDVVPEVAVSRFADAGLDDDRLPVNVKRRRGRRR